jgi:hypothetical protein
MALIASLLTREALLQPRAKSVIWIREPQYTVLPLLAQQRFTMIRCSALVKDDGIRSVRPAQRIPSGLWADADSAAAAQGGGMDQCTQHS